MLPHQTTSHQHHDYRVIIIQADLLKNITEWYVYMKPYMLHNNYLPSMQVGAVQVLYTATK